MALVWSMYGILISDQVYVSTLVPGLSTGIDSNCGGGPCKALVVLVEEQGCGKLKHENIFKCGIEFVLMSMSNNLIN